MASLPGVPGNLGLPSGTPQGIDGSEPNTSGSGTITLANHVFHQGLTGPSYLYDPAKSGSISIPATTSGNLLVVVIGTHDNYVGDVSQVTLTTNSGDSFLQVPWWSLTPPPAATAGHMASSGFGGNWSFDCWFCVCTGGATQLNWSVDGTANGPNLDYWIYEFHNDVFSDWTMLENASVYDIPFADDPPDFDASPYLGPILAASDERALVTIAYIADEDFPHTLDPPWTMEEYLHSFCGAYAIASGSQQPSFSDSIGEAGTVWILAASFVPTTSGGGGGTPPPPDTDSDLPNSWITC